MPRYIGRLFLSALVTLIPFSAMPVANAQASDESPVIISEIGWAGSSLSTSDEWLELTNLSDETIDISGWTLSGAATSNGTLTIPENSSVAPHESFLISNYGNDDAKSTLERIPDMVTASVSLSNSALSVTLSDGEGTIRDRAGDASSPLAGSTGDVIASMMRSAPVGDGTLETSWLTASSASGFDAGAMELGTPGTAEDWFVPIPAAAAVSDEPTQEVAEEPVSVVDEEPAPVAENVATEQPNGENADTVVTPEDTTLAPSAESTPSDATEPETAIFDEVADSDPQDETDVPSDVPPATVEPVASIDTVAVEQQTEQATESTESANDMNVVETSAIETEITTVPESVEQTYAEPEAELAPTNTVEIIPTETPALLINELASDADTEWIEILNASDDAIALSGWTVRDATLKATALPDQTLGAGEYIVVEKPLGRLNNDGDTVELLDVGGAVTDSVTYGTDEIPAAEKPNVLARDEGGAWTITTMATPGATNVISDEPVVTTEEPDVTVENTDALTNESSDAGAEEKTADATLSSDPLATLLLNEIASDAESEWIEIRNAGNETIALSGWTVRDATLKTTALPDQTLGAGQFFMVYDPAGKLNNDGDLVELLNPTGEVVDSVEYGTDEISAAGKQKTLARDESGGWLVTAAPTPGAANSIVEESGVATTEIEPVDAETSDVETDTTTDATETAIPDTQTETVAESCGDLTINELVSDADAEWIEIFNACDAVVSLSGWTVRDATGRATSFPDQPLESGQYAVVYDPAGKLNNDGDTVELLNPSGEVVDSVEYGTDDVPAADTPDSLARDESGNWHVTQTPTPGAANAATEENADDSTSSEESATGGATSTTNGTGTNDASIEAYDEIAEETWSGPITLRLSEFYPNTTGDDLAEEFIEVENTGTEDVDLEGWSLLDATNRAHVFTSSVIIEPGDLLALMRAETNIALNNTTDTVTLMAPDGTIVDTKSYASPPKGSSLIRSDAKWVWTRTPTPNEPNVLSQNEASGSAAARPASSETTSSNVAATSGARRSMMAQAEGTVLVEPGALGKQIFYIETENGGLQIYKYDSDFPDLTPGDRVLVTGVMTESRGEARLKVSDGGTITIVSDGIIPTAEDAAISGLTSADHGRLIRVSGTVLSRSGSKAVIEDQGAKLTVRVAEGTGIDAALLARGTSVTITGILVSTDAGLTLLPRSADDISIEQPEVAESVGATIAGINSRDSQNRGIALAITTAVIIGLGFYSSRRIIRAVKHWYAKAHALRAASQTAH